jgi:putative membrane protein
MVDREVSHPGEPDTRFVLANERTSLAWSRTSLALLVAGGAIGQVVDRVGVVPSVVIAGLLVLMGVGVALSGLRRWRQVNAALLAGESPPPAHGVAYLAYGLAIVGGVIAIALATGPIR